MSFVHRVHYRLSVYLVEKQRFIALSYVHRVCLSACALSYNFAVESHH